MCGSNPLQREPAPIGLRKGATQPSQHPPACPAALRRSYARCSSVGMYILRPRCVIVGGRPGNIPGFPIWVWIFRWVLRVLLVPELSMVILVLDPKMYYNATMSSTAGVTRFGPTMFWLAWKPKRGTAQDNYNAISVSAVCPTYIVRLNA